MSHPCGFCTLLGEDKHSGVGWGSCPYSLLPPIAYSGVSSGEMFSLVIGSTCHLLLFDTRV